MIFGKLKYYDWYFKILKCKLVFIILYLNL